MTELTEGTNGGENITQTEVEYESLQLAELKPGMQIVVEWPKFGCALKVEGTQVKIDGPRILGPGIYTVCDEEFVLDMVLYRLVEGLGVDRMVCPKGDDDDNPLDRFFVSGETFVTKIVYADESTV